MEPADIIAAAIDEKFATPSSKGSRFAAAQLATAILDALRSQGYQVGKMSNFVQSKGFVCTVPDHCDRVVWRKRYLHLDAQADRPASYDALRNIASDTGEAGVLPNDLTRLAMLEARRRRPVAPSSKDLPRSCENWTDGVLAAILAEAIEEATRKDDLQTTDADSPDHSDGRN